ncbi:hypothetical protein L596_016039 [Steinernema carpocapsae]|uniref:MITD1 C-terminal phospholipase D-like domain-containing protein n=1 Tax=Steinernema carpocapsae TaxID=34508 RepID=A0A4U5NHL8_STECR|nr:hypothetical protein L596_016039 [Steinernema carpocapsae]
MTPERDRKTPPDADHSSEGSNSNSVGSNPIDIQAGRDSNILRFPRGVSVVILRPGDDNSYSEASSYTNSFCNDSVEFDSDEYADFSEDGRLSSDSQNRSRKRNKSSEEGTSEAKRSRVNQEAQEMENLAQTLFDDAKDREKRSSETQNEDKAVSGEHLLKAAVKFYQVAILLQEASKAQENEDSQEARTYVLKNISLMERFQKIVHKTIKIMQDSRGHGFVEIFGSCLDDRLTSVIVEDPCIHSQSQVRLFTDFCELLASRAPNLKIVALVTRPEAEVRKFDSLKILLLQKGIMLIISRRESLHDREIVFDNGWIVKIGRGLDIYKKPFMENQAERLCKETTVDVIRLHVLW